MSQTVSVVCRACKGQAEGCGWCMTQGHESINRSPDGSVPSHFDTGEPVVEHVPPTLPETPPNRLEYVSLPDHPRCC